MTRRIRRIAILLALVAVMTLGGASAAFGHGKSHDAKCGNTATISNPATATGSAHWSPQTATAWDNGQNAWHRCTVLP